MKKMEEYYVPWMKGQQMYISSHIELAWKEPVPQTHDVEREPLAALREGGGGHQQVRRMANRYPDQGLLVRAKIAEINGLAGPENVLLGNGSSEVFDMIWRSLIGKPGDEVIQHTPCFGIYKLRCVVCGGKLVSVPMRYENKRAALRRRRRCSPPSRPKTKVIVIANPNNPTGNFMDAEALSRPSPKPGLPFVVDEAYVEYAGLGKSQVALTKKYENVMITRTLSKAYGLAGLRFGYCWPPNRSSTRSAATLIPWNVGTIAMWGALAAFEDEAALKQRVEHQQPAIEMFEKELGKIKGLNRSSTPTATTCSSTAPNRQEGQGPDRLRAEEGHHPARRRKTCTGATAGGA